MSKISKNETEWKSQLTDEQYRVTREAGTEMAFSGKYYDHHEIGTYYCVCCGAPLFDSDHKYDSGSGWPSFWAPLREDNVDTREDHSHGMKRVEVRCADCDAHLGHVFHDGPKPTGTRFCINSAALDFKSRED